MLTQKDFKALNSINKNTLLIQEQLLKLRAEKSDFSIVKPAALGEGIQEFSSEEQTLFQAYFDQHGSTISPLKFVPASGLASRMFLFLREFIDSFDPLKVSIENYFADGHKKELQFFVEHLEEYPFYLGIKNYIDKKKGPFKNRGQFFFHFVQTLLEDQNLGMEGKAKALLPIFNSSKELNKTAYEFQILEALSLFSNTSNVKIHFAIDPDQLLEFIALEKEFCKQLSMRDQKRLQIDYSFQNTNTDSVSLNENNTILRDKKNQIVFRKAGHGALLENIKRIQSDLVFIKTVDSVWPDDNSCVNSQKTLGGLYLKNLNKIESLLNYLKENGPNAVENTLSFIKESFHIDLNQRLSSSTLEEKKIFLMEFLNRPLRVCGMILNSGKHGGAPFWVEKDEQRYLQIVESSELEDKPYTLKDSSFFNPVNMVCGLKNFDQKPWDLEKFKDDDRYIISKKVHKGRTIKIFEYPGLWNGSMAYWNSIFVKIPQSTFRSLKTINDCLEQKKS
tara:strand:+ start:4794 stop:6308 length:1515 start_codon:yes stop_codon:yes gene_type:complete